MRTELLRCGSGRPDVCRGSKKVFMGLPGSPRDMALPKAAKGLAAYTYTEAEMPGGVLKRQGL
jgi:hypothetical protein